MCYIDKVFRQNFSILFLFYFKFFNNYILHNFVILFCQWKCVNHWWRHLNCITSYKWRFCPALVFKTLCCHNPEMAAIQNNSILIICFWNNFLYYSDFKLVTIFTFLCQVNIIHCQFCIYLVVVIISMIIYFNCER